MVSIKHSTVTVTTIAFTDLVVSRLDISIFLLVISACMKIITVPTFIKPDNLLTQVRWYASMRRFWFPTLLKWTSIDIVDDVTAQLVQLVE